MAVVCGVGTGGTLHGTGAFFFGAHRTAGGDRASPILPAPCSPAFAAHRPGANPAGTPGLVEGIGGESSAAGCVTCHPSKKAYTISDAEVVFATCRELLLREGILGGTSSGTFAGGAALRLLPRANPSQAGRDSGVRQAATNICPRCTTTIGCSIRVSCSAERYGDLAGSDRAAGNWERARR